MARRIIDERKAYNKKLEVNLTTEQRYRLEEYIKDHPEYADMSDFVRRLLDREMNEEQELEHFSDTLLKVIQKDERVREALRAALLKSH